MKENMKVKVRFKLEQEKGKVLPIRRIAVGELKKIPESHFVPETVAEHFIFLEGRNFFVEKHQQIADTVQEETKQMFIPLAEIRSITVLPDDIDIYDMEYKISGNRLICQSTKHQVTLREEGRVR